MSDVDRIIAFSVKAFGTFGVVSIGVKSSIALWAVGPFFSLQALLGAAAIVGVIWGFFK